MRQSQVGGRGNACVMTTARRRRSVDLPDKESRDVSPWVRALGGHGWQNMMEDKSMNLSLSQQLIDLEHFSCGVERNWNSGFENGKLEKWVGSSEVKMSRRKNGCWSCGSS